MNTSVPATAHSHQTLDVKEALMQGWEITKKYWGYYILLGVAIVFSAIILGMLGTVSHSGIWSLVMFILNIAFQTMVGVAVTRFVLNAVDGKPVVFKDLVTTDWMLLLYVLGTNVLMSIAIFLGFIALIIPGIILSLMFSFAMYAAVEKKLDPIQALKASVKLTDGNKVNIFLYWLAIVGLSLAAVALPFLLMTLSGALLPENAMVVGVIISFLLLLPAIMAAVAISFVSTFGFGYMYRKISNARPDAFKV